MSSAFYLALTPWLTFAVADRSAGLRPQDAALVATAVALTIGAHQLRRRPRYALSVLSVVLFAASAAVVMSTGRSGFLGRDDRAVVFGVLAIYLLGSLVRKPVTLTYASEAQSPRLSSSPSFRRYHTKLTLQWSLAVAAIALSYAAGAVLHGQVTATVFNWFIPIAVIVVIASRPKAPPQSASDETSPVLNGLDSFLSHPANPRHSERAPARPPLRLLPQSSFRPSQHTQARRSEA